MPYKETNIIIAGGTVIFNGVPLGWTRDALTIGYEDEEFTIDNVQQIRGVVDVRKIKVRGIVIKLNLYEFTLENLRLALGINATIEDTGDERKLNLDFSGDYHKGETVIYCKGEGNVKRTVVIYNSQLKLTGDIPIDAENPTVLPITIRSLVHPDYDEEGYIAQDYTPSSVVVE
jgi:hypothetical protein